MQSRTSKFSMRLNLVSQIIKDNNMAKLSLDVVELPANMRQYAGRRKYILDFFVDFSCCGFLFSVRQTYKYSYESMIRV